MRAVVVIAEVVAVVVAVVVAKGIYTIQTRKIVQFEFIPKRLLYKHKERMNKIKYYRALSLSIFDACHFMEFVYQLKLKTQTFAITK